jgi:hypothetical protein
MMTDDLPEGVTDVTPEEAVADHEPGAMHCCTSTRWQQIADSLMPDDHPWLKGHVGRVTVPGIPEFPLVCIDTAGLAPEEVNYVLHIFYGTPDPTNPDGSGEIGVMEIEGTNVIAKSLHEAKKRDDRRRR